MKQVLASLCAAIGRCLFALIVRVGIRNATILAQRRTWFVGSVPLGDLLSRGSCCSF